MKTESVRYLGKNLVLVEPAFIVCLGIGLGWKYVSSLMGDLGEKGQS